MKLHPYTGDTVGIHGKVQEIMNHHYQMETLLEVQELSL